MFAKNTSSVKIAPKYTSYLSPSLVSSSLSSNPNICHNNTTCPKGLSLPNKTLPASYRALGFFTSAHSFSYARTRRLNEPRWTRPAITAERSGARRGDDTGSGVDSHKENLVRDVWSALGSVAGSLARGVWVCIRRII